MYTIDTETSKTHYIIRDANGVEVCKISKAKNTLEQVKKYFEVA